MSQTPHATLHLRVLGESRKVSVAVPPTPAQADDVLAAARTITEVTMAVAFEKTAASGAPASCRKGCAACCHHLVSITAPEAPALARLVDAMPPERQAQIRERFAQAVAFAKSAGILDPASPDGMPVVLLRGAGTVPERFVDLGMRYIALHRPCVFLEDGACSIYEDRPLICREYAVTSSPDYCATLDMDAMAMIEAPVQLSNGLADITAVVEQRDRTQIPLFAALAWAARTENAAPEPNVSGVDLLKLLAKWVDSRSNVPLGERPE